MDDKREINPKSLSTNFDSAEIVMGSSKDESHSPASFQLMEVSRGAQKLSNMIEGWSKSAAQPKDIAKELLKGAIDLQDSLVMLGKLQEASRYMARLKREQQAMEEGSGRRTEELKKVIRESLVKQNLVSPVGELCKSASVSTTSESSCSSQSSSLARQVNDSSGSKKGPNLIARLMGLQEYPVTRFQARHEKRLEGIKVQDKTRYEERQSLREILESMRHKGVLRNNSASEGLPSDAASDQSNIKKKSMDDGPPIVLIKPLRVPSPEPKETCKSVSTEEEDPLYRRKMLRKLRRSEEGTDKRFTEATRREVLPKEKEVAAKVSASNKSRASGSVNQRRRRNEGVEIRGDKLQKVTAVKRNSVEKDVAKNASVVKSEDHAKRTVIKSRKSGSESNAVKNRNSRRVSTQPSATDQSTVHSSSTGKKNYTKKERPVKKSSVVAKIVIESSGSELDQKKTEICSESECHEVQMHINSETELAILEHQLCKEGIDVSKSMINDSQSPIEHINHEKCMIGSPDNIKTLKSEASLKALLLSSTSFQNHADELFDLNITTSRAPEQSCTENLGESNAKLLLDCANEIIERKSAQDSKALHFLLPTCASKLLRRGVSVETLVEEVSDAVEALREYHQASGDGLYATLERDLTCRGAMNGVWDSCWDTGFSFDESERVVRDIERLVLSALIEEVFAC